MSKSIPSGSGKKRRVDFTNLESAIQGGKYENVDEVIAQSLIPKLEGMSLSLDQLQKRLVKLDRENKLLRKETDTIRLKSTFFPKSVKIECPKCKNTMDSPNEFISHLEIAHFYVEQECVIDRANAGLSVRSKVAPSAPPAPSFGETLPPESSKPIRTGRIPRKSQTVIVSHQQQSNSENAIKAPLPEKQPPVTDQFTPNPAYSLRMPQHNDIFTPSPRQPIRFPSPATNFHQINAKLQTRPVLNQPLRMKFGHKIPPNTSIYSSTPTHSPIHPVTRQMYTGSVHSPNKDFSGSVHTSPSQSGTIARARTAAPLSKTSPKLSHISPGNSLTRTSIHANNSALRTNISPIDLTEPRNDVEANSHHSETQSGYQVALKYNPSLPIPQVTVAVNAGGNLVISWSLTKEQNISVVSSYEIRAFQTADKSSAPVEDWKRIGLVRAMCPPMACTMCRIANGKLYSFVVRSIDKFGWHGQFSEIQSIQV